MSRTVSWFSCGAASAVATKLALADNPETIVAYCEVKQEHPDNQRFLLDCQKWFGKQILVLGNDKYDRSTYEVFRKTRYLVGPGGARCTGELKKKVREQWALPDDINVFGYTAEEQHRLDRLLDSNNGLRVVTPLIDHQLNKQDCLAMINNAGIELPAMYKLGFKNNNCVGCVKASSPSYWRLVERHFPEQFAEINEIERELGRAVNKIDMGTVKKRYPEIYERLKTEGIHEKMYWRPQLHELPDDIIAMDNSPDVQCGIFCHMAEEQYRPTENW